MTALSLKFSLPSAISLNIADLVIGFEMLAMRNRESGWTGELHSTLANPYPLANTNLPSFTTANDPPGISHLSKSSVMASSKPDILDTATPVGPLEADTFGHGEAAGVAVANLVGGGGEVGVYAGVGNRVGKGVGVGEGTGVAVGIGAFLAGGVRVRVGNGGVGTGVGVGTGASVVNGVVVGTAVGVGESVGI